MYWGLPGPPSGCLPAASPLGATRCANLLGAPSSAGRPAVNCVSTTITAVKARVPATVVTATFFKMAVPSVEIVGTLRKYARCGSYYPDAQSSSNKAQGSDELEKVAWPHFDQGSQFLTADFSSLGVIITQACGPANYLLCGPRRYSSTFIDNEAQDHADNHGQCAHIAPPRARPGITALDRVRRLFSSCGRRSFKRSSTPAMPSGVSCNKRRRGPLDSGSRSSQ